MISILGHGNHSPQDLLQISLIDSSALGVYFLKSLFSKLPKAFRNRQVDSHTVPSTSDFIWSRKLSRVRPGWHLDGRYRQEGCCCKERYWQRVCISRIRLAMHQQSSLLLKSCTYKIGKGFQHCSIVIYTI